LKKCSVLKFRKMQCSEVQKKCSVLKLRKMQCSEVEKNAVF
jgi:hypothetical protein